MKNTTPNLDHRLGFLLSDCHRLLGTTLDRLLRQAGLELSRAQWRVIGHLSRTDGVTQTQLAELMDMERAPLGTLVDKLENAQLVERRADPSDRRVNRVFVTEAGLKVIPMIHQQADKISDEIMTGLPPEHFDILIDSLEIIKQNLLAQRDGSKAA